MHFGHHALFTRLSGHLALNAAGEEKKKKEICVPRQSRIRNDNGCTERRIKTKKEKEEKTVEWVTYIQKASRNSIFKERPRRNNPRLSASVKNYWRSASYNESDGA